MDPKLLRIFQLIESKKKTSNPWKRQERHAQPYYTYSSQKTTWHEGPLSQGPASTTCSGFSILSWNVDFMLPFANERMSMALKHLKTHVESTKLPTIIMLQEMLETDLELIMSIPWITSSYNLTDLNAQHWESGHYGTLTLIPKALPIKSVFRVHYQQTAMERDGLFVDVDLGRGTILRICNTHLESLIADPPKRPHQLATAAQHMKDPAVSASVLGGDLNAIQPFDHTLHSDNGLQDAYLVNGGQEDSDKGHTWGHMAPVKLRTQFGTSRMDKFYFVGDLKLESFQKFGLGVEVEDPSIRDALIQEDGLDGGWVTDHLGVKAEFSIVRSDSSPSKI